MVNTSGNTLKTSVSTRRTLQKLIKQVLPQTVYIGLRACYDAERSWRDSWVKQRNRYVTQKQVRLLLANSNGVPLKVELGSGPVHGSKGWITADTAKGADLLINFLEPLPFPDNSIGAYYSSHVLEHFTDPNLIALLRECYRSLHPGGTFSVAVPNARIYLEAYFDSQPFDFTEHPPYKPALFYRTKIDLVNYIAYLGDEHHHLFDQDNLVAILQEVGFRNARLRDFDPQVDLPARHHESLYAIAEKQS